jgi:hypothetical protein
VYVCATVGVRGRKREIERKRERERKNERKDDRMREIGRTEE